MLKINILSHETTITLNKGCTMDTLKQCLEIITLIPRDYQIIKIKNSCLDTDLREPNGSCLDTDLEIEVEGPLFATLNLYDINEFNLQFSNGNKINLMPKYYLLWIDTECFDHIRDDYCYLCNSTGKITTPIYYQLLPCINSDLIKNDILATFDIHGSNGNKYNIEFRYHVYPAAILESPSEKIVRILVSDIANDNCNTVCQDLIKTSLQFCKLNFDSYCIQCNGTIFTENDYIAWVWVCPDCKGQMHSICALRYFSDNGTITCNCTNTTSLIQIRRQLNHLRNHIIHVANTSDTDTDTDTDTDL
jgi:hypothetical protein